MKRLVMVVVVVAATAGNLAGRITAPTSEYCGRAYFYGFVEAWPAAERERRFLLAASSRVSLSEPPGPPGTGNGVARKEKVVLFAGNELAGPEYDATIAEVRASLPGAPGATIAEVRASLPGVPGAGPGTALAVSTRMVPWGDVVLVAILVMAFAGWTVAIVRSSRRR